MPDARARGAVDFLFPEARASEAPASGPIGALRDGPPYRAWRLGGGAWAVRGAGGWNCWGLDGAVLLRSREDAEAVIRSHGHEPGEPA